MRPFRGSKAQRHGSRHKSWVPNDAVFVSFAQKGLPGMESLVLSRGLFIWSQTISNYFEKTSVVNNLQQNNTQATILKIRENSFWKHREDNTKYFIQR